MLKWWHFCIYFNCTQLPNTFFFPPNRTLHHHFLQYKYIYKYFSVWFSFCSLIPVPHYSSVCGTLPQDPHFLATACHQTFGTSSTTPPPLSLLLPLSFSPSLPPSVCERWLPWDCVLSPARAGWQCPALPVPVRDSINSLCIQSNLFSSRALSELASGFINQRFSTQTLLCQSDPRTDEYKKVQEQNHFTGLWMKKGSKVNHFRWMKRIASAALCLKRGPSSARTQGQSRLLHFRWQLIVTETIVKNHFITARTRSLL